ncbi:MAG TPA: outer membrane protein assembly factor BamD [Candidatus Sulfopaludibacter sp.]|nr:outer membrane protein assembly factor BamD [Candidatus Sulfopaludibacter sp.]
MAITLAPERSQAASKEIQELQRDIAQLQDQMKQLQQAQDKNFAAITVLTQQALDASNRANTAVAVIQSSIQQSLKDQQEKVVAPVVGLSSRMDSMSNDFRTVSQAVSDLTSTISQLKGQLTDINNAVKVLGQPAVAPPGSTTPAGPGGPGGPGGPPQASAMPQMSSQDLFLAAKNDNQGGNLDLALQEYSDYLKYFPTTDNAPLAQYAIAQIHYSKGDYESAANEFDMVLEKYPENSRTKDAMYYKGVSLVKAGKRTQGKDEFVELINHYPHTDMADKACSQITALGLRCPAPAAPRSSKKKKD